MWKALQVRDTVSNSICIYTHTHDIPPAGGPPMLLKLKASQPNWKPTFFQADTVIDLRWAHDVLSVSTSQSRRMRRRECTHKHITIHASRSQQTFCKKSRRALIFPDARLSPSHPPHLPLRSIASKSLRCERESSARASHLCSTQRCRG